MRQEELDDLGLQGAEVAVTAYSGDPLQGCGGWDGVGGVWVEGGSCGSTRLRCSRGGACAGGIEEGVEAARFGNGGAGSGVGEHVGGGGDDGVEAWGGEFDPIWKVKTR